MQRKLPEDYEAIKPLIVAEWPSVDAAELDETGGDPDAIVQLVVDRTGHTRTLIARQLQEFLELAEQIDQDHDATEEPLQNVMNLARDLVRSLAGQSAPERGDLVQQLLGTKPPTRDDAEPDPTREAAAPPRAPATPASKPKPGMKHGAQCPSCGCQRQWRVERVASVLTPGTGRFDAYICADCGYTELFAEDIAALQADPDAGVHYLDSASARKQKP